MTTICANLQAVERRIFEACSVAGRDPSEVRLLAVSKTWPASDVASAAACGQCAFGESYVQEAVAKIGELRVRLPSLEWHFIGPIQSNKTRPIAEHFDWVHSIDRLKIAERLSAQRPAGMPPLCVCLQVNVSGEDSKSGCEPGAAVSLAEAIAGLPGLRLRGLMTIPEPTDDVALQRRRFALLRTLRGDIEARGIALDTLSMGMSDDLESAIAEGATLVRVGTAIFGRRS